MVAAAVMNNGSIFSFSSDDRMIQSLATTRICPLAGLVAIQHLFTLKMSPTVCFSFRKMSSPDDTESFMEDFLSPWVLKDR